MLKLIKTHYFNLYSIGRW